MHSEIVDTNKSSIDADISAIRLRIFNLGKSIYFWLDCILPFLLLFVSFSKSNPLLRFMVQLRRQYVSEEVHVLVCYTGQAFYGFVTWIGALILLASFGTGIFISGYGVALAHRCTLGLVPGKYDGKLRGGLCFGEAVKIYKEIRIMCIIHSGLARDFVTTCMHHFYLVAWASLGMWALLEPIVDGGPISILITLGSSTTVVLDFTLEWFMVNFVSKAATGSKEFLHRMKKYNARSKYRRRVLQALLPNSINLEIIGSVDTIRDGIQGDYFINFVSRVTDNTIGLLLAKSKTEFL